MGKKKQTGKKEPNKAKANEPAASALAKRDEGISMRMLDGDYIDPFPFDKDPADDRVFDMHTGPTILHTQDYLFLRDAVENMEAKYLHYSTEIKDKALRVKTYMAFRYIQAFIKKTFKRLELLLSGHHYYSTPSAKRPLVKPSSLFDPCSIEDYLNSYLMIGAYYNDSMFSDISGEMKKELSKDIHLMLITTFDVLAAMLPCKEVSDLRSTICQLTFAADPNKLKRQLIERAMLAVSGALANEEPKWERERLTKNADMKKKSKAIYTKMKANFGAKGLQTIKQSEQLIDFVAYVKAKTGKDFPKGISELARDYWKEHKKDCEKAAKAKGQEHGYDDDEGLTKAFNSLKYRHNKKLEDAGLKPVDMK